MHDPLLRRLFILAFTGFIGWVIYLLMPVIAPFIAAFLLAYLINPLVEKLSLFHLPRWLSISGVFLAVTVLLVLASWYLIPLLWEQVGYAINNIPAAISWVNRHVLPWLEQYLNLDIQRIKVNELTEAVMTYVQTNYSTGSVQQMVYQVAQSGLSIIHVGGLLFLIPIIAFYFLLDWNDMLTRLQRLIPRHYEPQVVHVANECHAVLGAFVKGQLLVMLLLGLVYAIGLQLVGIKVGLIIGLMAGLFSIIPYLGFATGLVAAIIASGLQYGADWVHLALVGMVFLIGQIIEGYVLQPFLLGDKIGLSPVAVVFAVLAGAQLYGFIGMLIALPVAAVLVVLLRHAYQSYEDSVFYRGYRLPASIQATPPGASVTDTPLSDANGNITELTLQHDAPEIGLQNPKLK